MTNWMHLDTDAEVQWPTGDMSTRAASGTAVQAEALNGRMTGRGLTTIKSVQSGASHVVGVLQILGYDGTTLVREITVPTSSANNLGFNNQVLDFSFPGGFSVFMDNASGTVDVFIGYEYDERGNA